MLVRVIACSMVAVLGVIAVVSTKEYLDLATGRTVVDFIPWERNGQAQREHIAFMRMVAIGSTLGCLTAFVFAFYRRTK